MGQNNRSPILKKFSRKPTNHKSGSSGRFSVKPSLVDTPPSKAGNVEGNEMLSKVREYAPVKIKGYTYAF